MRIAVFEVEDWEREAFESLYNGHEVFFDHKALTPEHMPENTEVEVISTFIYSKATAEILERFPNLRLVTTRSTGYDHIDRLHCKERGILLCNVPSYGSNTVAEHAFALLLNISHKIEEAVDRTRKGDFSSRGLQGFDLFGKTVGVVGTGLIGQCFIRIARGFGMHVLAYDVYPKKDASAALGFRYVDLDTLYRESDIISFHVPATSNTRHMVNEETLHKMKRGVILINTARGDLMDMPALVRALAEKHVAAAGLDVLADEPAMREEAELLRRHYNDTHDLENLLADHVLLRLRNVIVTPHSAFNTHEAVRSILDTTVANIRAFADGDPQNVVLPPE